MGSSRGYPIPGRPGWVPGCPFSTSDSKSSPRPAGPDPSGSFCLASVAQSLPPATLALSLQSSPAQALPWAPAGAAASVPGPFPRLCLCLLGHLPFSLGIHVTPPKWPSRTDFFNIAPTAPVTVYLLTLPSLFLCSTSSVPPWCCVLCVICSVSVPRWNRSSLKAGVHPHVAISLSPAQLLYKAGEGHMCAE